MTYSEKLKDPRWQKKRLEVLNRDNFMCTQCCDSRKTLHVHHLKYNGNPWDVEIKYLKTLCEDCHKEESFERESAEENLIRTLKEGGVTLFNLKHFTEWCKKQNDLDFNIFCISDN